MTSEKEYKILLPDGWEIYFTDRDVCCDEDAYFKCVPSHAAIEPDCCYSNDECAYATVDFYDYEIESVTLQRWNAEEERSEFETYYPNEIVYTNWEWESELYEN